MRNVKREINLLNRLDHPYLIKLPFVFEDKQVIVLGMEYVGKISLHNYLKTNPERKMGEKEAKKIF